MELLPPLKPSTTRSSRPFAKDKDEIFSTPVALDRLISIAEVKRITSLSVPTIYREMAAGRFPLSVPVTRSRVAWLSSEIAEWKRARVAARGAMAT